MQITKLRSNPQVGMVVLIKHMEEIEFDPKDSIQVMNTLEAASTLGEIINIGTKTYGIQTFDTGGATQLNCEPKEFDVVELS